MFGTDLTQVRALICFLDFDDYLDLQMNVNTVVDCFSLAENQRATSQQIFMIRQLLGCNSFNHIVRTVCVTEGIFGSESKTWVTTHGSRGTLSFLLFTVGHLNTSVALRTRHRSSKSLFYYQNLRAKSSKDLQNDISRESLTIFAKIKNGKYKLYAKRNMLVIS